MSDNRFVLIMAGGVGSRFWPMSRETRPKQFLDILGTGKSLIRLTFERCLKLVPASNVMVLTHENYKDLILEHLPELNEDQVFLEPSRNNTGPCIAYASFKLKKRFGDGVCLVAPSDAVILKEDTFVETVNRGFKYCEANSSLMTIGITPTRPDTGYGYIRFEEEQLSEGINSVRNFTEKPDSETANKFLQSGDYLWNSGMFIWSLNSVLDAFKTHSTNTYNILAAGMDVYDTDQETAFLKDQYPLTDKLSVDYAVMERSENVAVMPADLGWSDLGTWGSLYQYLSSGSGDNVEVGGQSRITNSKGCLVVSDTDQLIVGSDLEDIVVICEKDVVLVFPRDKEQQVKSLRASLEDEGMQKYL